MSWLVPWALTTTEYWARVGSGLNPLLNRSYFPPSLLAPREQSLFSFSFSSSFSLCLDQIQRSGEKDLREMRRSGALVRCCCLVVLAVASALCVSGPALYWRYKKSFAASSLFGSGSGSGSISPFLGFRWRSASSCAPCSCDCPPPLSLPVLPKELPQSARKIFSCHNRASPPVHLRPSSLLSRWPTKPSPLLSLSLSSYRSQGERRPNRRTLVTLLSPGPLPLDSASPLTTCLSTMMCSRHVWSC